MRLEIFIILLAVVLLVFVIEVVRRRHLSEGYALLWISVAAGGVLLGISRHLIDRFSDSLGISYGANLVFAAVFVFLIIVSINLSMHVSTLEDKVAALAEEIAILHGPQPAGPSDGSPSAEGAAPRPSGTGADAPVPERD